MASNKLSTLLWLATAAAAAAAASCANLASSTSGAPASTTTPTTTTTGSGDAQRALAEADIIQLDGGRLFAMSRSGTVSVVDVSTPGRLTLLGQTTLPGEPFEMYRRGGFLLAMSNGAVASDGTVGPTPPLDGTSETVPPTSTGSSPTTTGDGGGTSTGAAVMVLDVRDPTHLGRLATFPVPGEIADSRVVGDVLYLATYENAACYGCGPAPRTLVTSFDVSAVTAMRQVEQVSFQSNAPDGYNLPWGTNWKRSIFVTDQRLYIGGHADIDPQSLGAAGNREGIIDVLDVTDPTGRLGVGARLQVAGAILSRWQLDEDQGVLRVLSQQGAGRTGNGLGAPEVDTFSVAGATSFQPLGHLTMKLPRQEGLRTVRFDGPRAYAITYNQTDPLFVIDLADPRAPAQTGELFMPGFMFHLEPYGDRVIGLGIDRNDPAGSLNVSLFDVADPTLPRMLARAAFASPGITEDYQILNSEVSEDQDRIQKSFRVLPDGLVVAPFTALRPSYASGSGCDNDGGGVQLVQWTGDELRKHALLPLPGNPRRAFENGSELVAVSDSNVRAFSLEDLDVAHQTADLTIGACTTTSSVEASPINGGGVFPQRDNPGQYPTACAIAPGPGAALSVWGWALLLALGALAIARGRGRRPPRSPLELARRAGGGRAAGRRRPDRRRAASA